MTGDGEQAYQNAILPVAASVIILNFAISLQAAWELPREYQLPFDYYQEPPSLLSPPEVPPSKEMLGQSDELEELLVWLSELEYEAALEDAWEPARLDSRLAGMYLWHSSSKGP